ncbi:hypothetical protein AYI68_g377 [Smittium mucronatum]|uniref:Uncharacterized protein n=1 Tax=Smittium mucronatum TaxID=133383 RepID=A0A1R0H8J8_9FUNG|nr:hypothetical protein AYI68_g377 [Smittium mucronatum]
MRSPIPNSPIPQSTRGRSKNNKKAKLSLTKMKPSYFEFIDISMSKKCGFCENTGHNTRTCTSYQTEKNS